MDELLSAQYVRWALAALAVLVVALLLRRLFRRPPESPHTEKKRCQGCGWTGEMSRYRPVCPKCGKAL